MIRRAIIFLLLTTAASVCAEHITDKVLAGLYRAPDLSSELIKVIPTGTVFKVVKKEGDFSRIRFENGSEGWIESRFISYTKPTTVKLKELQEKFALVQKKLDQMQSAQTAEGGDSAPSAVDIEELQRSLSAAHEKLQQIEQQSAHLREGLKKALANLTTTTGDLSGLIQAQSDAKKEGTKAVKNPEKGLFSNGWLVLVLLILSVVAFTTVSILERRSKKGALHGASRVSPSSHTHREGSP